MDQSFLSWLEQQQESVGARESTRTRITALVDQLEGTGTFSDPGEATETLQQTISLALDSHSEYFNTLGYLLESRFQRTGTLSDLDGAIEHQRRAVSSTPDGHPPKAGHLNNLGSFLESRFRHTGLLSDVEEAIKNLQQAVSLAPDGHCNKPMYLTNLGNSLKSRFECAGVRSDLEEAIKHQRQAISLTPDGHPDKPIYFNNLGLSLESLFQCTGVLGDLGEAIDSLQQAVLLTPDSHHDKPMYFNSLGISLKRRFQRTGTLSDLEAAVGYQRRAVSLTPDDHPTKAGYLSNLGISLKNRFQRTRMLSDLEEAIKNQQQAVSLTPNGHLNKPIYFNNLGLSLKERFQHTGVLSDLGEAIENQQQAVSLTPDGYPNKSIYLNNLGLALESRFQSTGVLSDLEGAIGYHRRAMSLIPGGHPTKAGRLNNLGNLLESRFQYTGMLSDLEEAIESQQQAVSLTPDSHSDKPIYLGNLGSSFESRFQRTGMLGDLERAVEYQRRAVSLTLDDHPAKGGHLSSLGVSLQSRFGHTGMLGDLEEAIENQQKAISSTPDHHPHKPMCFNNLGISLERRFQRTGILSDLEEAIKNQQQAVSLMPDGHPDKLIYSSGLGSFLESRFDRTGSPSDLTGAISNFRLAATSNVGPIFPRCCASQQWARLEVKRDPPSALAAYRQAITLFPQVAWIGDPIATRHSQLTSLGDISREAAAFALDAGHPDLALEWLEQGCSVVWNQLLHLRTSVDHLHQANPDLCAEFTRISRELRSAATRGYNLIAPDHIENPISLEEETQRHHRLAEKWDLLVREIRLLPNFHDFLLPKKVSALMEAASSGPVVVINVHERRCDALVLDRGRDQVLHIPLSKLHYDDLTKMYTSLRLYLANCHRTQRWGNRAGGTVRPGGSSLIVKILDKIYSTVVYPILQGLDMTTARSESSHLPRIWWCPTGPLTFFPLHAACRTTGTKTNGTFSYAVSSYTPTINALLEARSVKDRPFKQLLGIAMANTPGQIPLPGVKTEIAKIEELLAADSRRSFEILRNEQATREQVLSRMANSSWVHLACHAVQDKQEPTLSGFCLHDRRLTIMDIIAEPFGHADLAFLSACQTATGDENASDEAVHVTGAMLGAGYRNVIGTMWSIPDEAASVVATKVYEALLSGGEPNSNRAAQALHDAVKEMRESNHNSYTNWVPFVHYGV